MKLLLVLLTLLTVSCGKNEPITKLGEFAENVGQTPRILANQLLGTDSESDEKIDQLEKELEYLYSLTLEQFIELTGEIAALQAEDSRINDILQDEILVLKKKIKKVKRKNRQKIRDLRREVEDLSLIVSQIDGRIDSLEVVCTRFRGFLRSCELQEL